jgi:hypothetical protein
MGLDQNPAFTKAHLHEDQSRRLVSIKTSGSRAKLLPGIQFIAPPDSQFFQADLSSAAS